MEEVFDSKVEIAAFLLMLQGAAFTCPTFDPILHMSKAVMYTLSMRVKSAILTEQGGKGNDVWMDWNAETLMKFTEDHFTSEGQNKGTTCEPFGRD